MLTSLFLLFRGFSGIRRMRLCTKFQEQCSCCILCRIILRRILFGFLTQLGNRRQRIIHFLEQQPLRFLLLVNRQVIHHFRILSDRLFQIEKVLDFRSIIHFRYGFRFMIVHKLFIRPDEWLILCGSSCALEAGSRIECCKIEQPQIVQFDAHTAEAVWLAHADRLVTAFIQHQRP